jgi:hypothetical protein
MKLKLKVNDAIALAQLIDRHAVLPPDQPLRPRIPWPGQDEEHEPADLPAVRYQLDRLSTDHYEGRRTDRC